jgi:hypothetical protein
MAYERRGTAIYKYSYNPRALTTHMFSGRHNLARDSDGTLWALLQVSTVELYIMKSTDNGFTWEVVDDYWSSTAHYPRSNSAYNVNGPCDALMLCDKYNYLYSWHIRYIGLGSSWALYYGYLNTTDPAGTSDDYSTGVSWDAANMNGMFSMCHNTNTMYFLYPYKAGAIYPFYMRRISPRTVSISGSVSDNTGNNWEDVFDCCCNEDGEVFIVGVNINNGATAPTVEFIQYNESSISFGDAVVIDTTPSTSHFICDLAIAIDGYGTLCAVWGEMDDWPGSSTVAWRYAISKDKGLTWTVTDMTYETGYSAYKDAVMAEYCTRTDVIGGYDGGFLITYTQNDDSNTGVAQVEEITCEADSGGSLNNKYWWIFSDTTSYYVWYDVSSGGTDPTPSAPSGYPSTTSGIEVDITTDDTASSVATATQTAIDAEMDFSASVSGAIVTVTHSDPFPAKDAIDDGTNGTGWTSAWAVKVNGEGKPRSMVRRLSTDDGLTYTLGDEEDITNTPSDRNIAGAKFFDIAEGILMNLEEPGLVRCAFQEDEGNSKVQMSSIPIHIDQDILSVGPYPISYPSEDGSYTVETAGVDELLVSFNIVDDIGSNIDYYDKGYIGEYTTRYLNTFITKGTSVRILKYEPIQAVKTGDRSCYDYPDETWANIFIDPLSYGSPQVVEDPDNTTGYVEQDIRKVYLPPNLHLDRQFILNDGNFLKRTVWTMQYGGNEYELTQVVPRFINNQITHYDCNAYVVGPSYDPFSRVALPSET